MPLLGTGIGDRLTARWLGAAGTQVAIGSYFVPINRYGTEIGGIFAYSHVNVDLPNTANQPKITGDAYSYSALVSQPLDRDRVWVADGGLNIRRINNFFNDDLASQDDIRSLQVGLNFDKFDDRGHTFARVQNSFAPEWGGSSTFWKAVSTPTRL